MTDRPIPFKAPMVRAILDGRKTQTRRELYRVIKFHQNASFDPRYPPPRFNIDHPQFSVGQLFDLSPWRKVSSGDRLWVRETCGRRPASFLGIEATNGVESSYYVSDGTDIVDEHDFNICPWWRGKTLPSIHMPRRASRLTLIVESVKVERLQEISEEDAIAEGVRLTRDEHGEIPGVFVGKEGPKNLVAVWPSAVEAFRDVWESIYGVESWQKNPWCCAITFRAIHANIDSEEAKAASAS